ncbi:MAG: hypothetical protein AAGJ46_16785 [Planctomycetota bacterium]
MHRKLLAAFAVIALLAPSATAAESPDIRTAEQQVWTRPLPSRPNRLGHFYGNNVRRMQQGVICVNCQRYNQPLLRYFYVPRG